MMVTTHKEWPIPQDMMVSTYLKKIANRIEHNCQYTIKIVNHTGHGQYTCRMSNFTRHEDYCTCRITNHTHSALLRTTRVNKT